MGSTIGRQSMGGVTPKLAELTDTVLFDDIWRRPQLSPRDRSIVTVSALIAMNRVEQLPFHLARARDNGDTGNELAEIVTHLAFYSGWPTAASAANLLKQLEESSCP